MAETLDELFLRLLREGEHRYVGPSLDVTGGVHHLEWLSEAMRLIEITTPGALATRAADIYQWPQDPAVPYGLQQHLAMLSILRAAYKARHIPQASPSPREANEPKGGAPRRPPEQYQTQANAIDRNLLEEATRRLPTNARAETPRPSPEKSK